MAKKKPIGEQPNIMGKLAEYQPPWFDTEEKNERKVEESTEYKSLSERFAKLESMYEAQQQQLALRQFSSAPQVVQSEVKKAPAEVNLEGLPDPVVDSKAFTSELIKRINAQNEAKLAEFQTEAQVQAQHNQLVNNLWDGFKTAHPDWAEHDGLVETEARRVSQNMLSRGINVTQLMQAAPEMYYKELVGALDKKYPQLKKGEDTEEGDDEGETNRTVGVFGGTPSKQKGEEGTPTSEDENQAFLRSMAEARYKAGVR